MRELEKNPAHWTTRIDGVGSVGVQAVCSRGAFRPASPSSCARPRRRPRVPRVAWPKRGLGRSVPDGAKADGLDGLLAAAREIDASDVHLVAGRPVLMRVAGDLLPRGAPIHEAAVEKMIAAIVPERLRASLAEQGSCDFALDRGALGRFRVNVARQRTGLKGCFRCIPAGVPTLASLGLPAEIERATHHHQGLVLVTGPTGHGKTSTLAAIVDIINRETPAPRHHGRGSGRVRAPAQAGDDQPARGGLAHALVRERARRRRSARIRTSSSSASCATPRRCAWRSPPARPATWCSAP